VLSVVIPAFDSASWIPSTLDALAVAVERSGLTSEVIVVDDGSTDGTAAAAESMRSRLGNRLTVITQANSGRFAARWAGAEAASGELLLLIDSRVLLHPDALGHVARALEEQPELRTWNAHIVTDPSVPLVGRFWEVPTHIFWRSYLARPHRTLIDVQNFDVVPKGTTCFLVPTEEFRAACLAIWPSGDTRLVSDDTKLLRHLVERGPFVLDPGFSATYRPRTNVRGFLRHARDRGTLFVDSYGGTSAVRDVVLLLLALAPVLVVVALAIAAVSGGALAALVVAAFALLLAVAVPALLAAVWRAPARAIAGYLLYVIPFACVFWAGLVRGLIIHRRVLRFSRKAGV
jgi:glycosyltransferase involved in cell wall biosynthesis